MTEKLDYAEVRPENKWKILRDQWRFALWALYSSIGSMMLGFDFVVGGQILAMVGSCPLTLTDSSLLSNNNMGSPLQARQAVISSMHFGKVPGTVLLLAVMLSAS